MLDDDPDSGNVLCWVIERSYRVLRASTADEAVDFWHEHNGSIGLIVADIFLSSPVSGTQVAIQVRESSPHVAVLFTSGTPLEGWRDVDFENFKNLMSGRVDFLQKPFTAQALVRKVDALLNGDWSAIEAQALYENATSYRTGFK